MLMLQKINQIEPAFDDLRHSIGLHGLERMARLSAIDLIVIGSCNPFTDYTPEHLFPVMLHAHMTDLAILLSPGRAGQQAIESPFQQTLSPALA